MLSKHFLWGIINIEQFSIEYSLLSKYLLLKIIVIVAEKYSIENCCCSKIFHGRILLPKNFPWNNIVIGIFFMEIYSYRNIFYGKLLLSKYILWKIIVENYCNRKMFYTKFFVIEKTLYRKFFVNKILFIEN